MSQNPIKAMVDNAKPTVIVSPKLNLLRAADVKPERIRWLWPNKFAKGKISIIAGDPGLGKSMITTALATHVSIGSQWPVDNTPCPQGSVIMLSAEDDAADTIRPRLDACGADPNQVYILQMVNDIDVESGESFQRSFSLAQDIEKLSHVLTDLPDCQVITIDPISAYLGGTDSHKNADIRGLLTPLADLAQKHDVAVIGVTHLNKGSGPAMYRAMGSLAFVAAARAAFSVSKDKEDEHRRLMLPIKNNLGLDTGGVAYRVAVGVNSAPFIQWEDEAIHITADEALRQDKEERASPERDEAVEWLQDILSQGPVASKEIKKRALADGFSWITIRRAKDILGIQSKKSSFDKGWIWQRSDVDEVAHEDAQDAPVPNNMSTFENTRASSTKSMTYEGQNNEHLGEDCEDAHEFCNGHLRENHTNSSEDEGEL